MQNVLQGNLNCVYYMLYIAHGLPEKPHIVRLGRFDTIGSIHSPIIFLILYVLSRVINMYLILHAYINE